MAIRTPDNAVKSGFPSIARLKSLYSDVEVKALLVDQIADLVEFVNVGKTMNAKQVAETVNLVQQYFPHLNLADLKVFFERMKIGRYGKFYDRLDGQLILEKLDEYNGERMDAIEAINYDQHKRDIKNNPIGQGYHPNVIDVMKMAVGTKTWKSDPEPKQIPVDTSPVQRWMKQFDNLYKKFGTQVSGVRFLVFGPKRYALETFLDRKFINHENK